MIDNPQIPKWDMAALLGALAADAATRPQPRPFGAPLLPPGVIPAVNKRPENYLALDSRPVQSIYSYLNQSGGFCGLAFPGYQYLAELSQRSEYRAPAETLATEATRRGFELVGDGEGDHSKRIKEITQDMQDFGVLEHCRRLIEQDSYFGRSQLCINVKGQDNKTKLPLVVAPESNLKGRLLGFRTVEAMWTSPLAWNSNRPWEPSFYKPESWYVMSREWHASRILTFVSKELPDMLKPAYNFSGMSTSQLIEPYVARWLKTVDSVNRLISNFSKLGLATNMQTILQDSEDDKSALIKRAQLYTQLADNRGVMLLDKASEEMFLLNTPLSGLHELQAQAQEHMSAPTHTPLVKMFGITPTGLNASSEGEIKVWYDWVQASAQQGFLGQHLPTIINLLQLNRYGDIDPGIRIQWVPLDQPDDTELAAIRKSDADAGAVYVTQGVVSPEEERDRISRDPNSGYNNLTGPAPEHPDDLDAERQEEAAETGHERSEEAAENAHERDKEKAKIDAKNKPK